ncbi:hypothetical protein [Nocardia sp. NPDC127526]|uniref:hypothetical protein n=1 Tax=Nocardia sp. NPDC127526 TaxID=3345393 RepID=UPI003635FF0F
MATGNSTVVSNISLTISRAVRARAYMINEGSTGACVETTGLLAGVGALLYLRADTVTAGIALNADIERIVAHTKRRRFVVTRRGQRRLKTSCGRYGLPEQYRRSVSCYRGDERFTGGGAPQRDGPGGGGSVCGAMEFVSEAARRL